MSVYTVSLTTLSPLHIGDGLELRKDFDFVTDNKLTYRLNEDAILERKADQLRPDRQGQYRTPGQLLDERDYQDPSLFRYILRGSIRSNKPDARLKSFIKDVYDRPYIPGSSLKGAIRTALAWNGWKEIKPVLDRNAVGRNRSWAAQSLEKKIFGRDPNHDLMRALQVSDLHGLSEPGQRLAVFNAQVLTKRSSGSPIELEALVANSSLHGSIHLDDSLFSPLAERELSFSNRLHWFEQLIPRIQAHSQARLKKLADWFEDAQGGQRVADFYRQILQADPGPNAAFLQLGWGTGWDGKTYWTHLQSNPHLFEQLVKDFRLHKAGRNSPPRKTGDPFPRSKRAVMDVKKGVPLALAPFGWVFLEVKPK